MTWTRLGLEGEADFHQLAAGYGSKAVYVYNHEPNSRMPDPGIFFTLNDGITWQRAPAAGLSGDPACIAVHPENPEIVAVGTKSGLYLSSDAGDSFHAFASGQVLAVFFDLDGRHLWYGSYAEAPALARIEWRTGEQHRIALPPLGRDAVTYITQNPASRDEYAIATSRRSVFLSRDDCKSWIEIAHEGKG
ncbi:MAG: glycosyl hydrolase [Desulfobacteraceae bacterium]|nr:MAG: glycosyl hydrolase [Desulfobacteraceae bacterium]